MDVDAYPRNAGRAHIIILKNTPAVPPSDTAYWSTQIALGSTGGATTGSVLSFTRYAYLVAGDKLETAFSTCRGCNGDFLDILSNAQFSIEFIGI